MKTRFLLKAVLTAMIIILTVSFVKAQKTVSVTGNWSSNATWGGSTPPTSSDAVTINDGVVVTVDIAAVAASITVNAPAANNGITISGTNTLTVTTMGTFTAGSDTIEYNAAVAQVLVTIIIKRQGC